MKDNFRYINNCGRINIPVKIRQELKINETTPIKVSTQNGKIILEKQIPNNK